jgi:hypothetical protein
MWMTYSPEGRGVSEAGFAARFDAILLEDIFDEDIFDDIFEAEGA